MKFLDQSAGIGRAYRPSYMTVILRTRHKRGKFVEDRTAGVGTTSVRRRPNAFSGGSASWGRLFQAVCAGAVPSITYYHDLWNWPPASPPARFAPCTWTNFHILGS